MNGNIFGLMKPSVPDNPQTATAGDADYILLQ